MLLTITTTQSPATDLGYLLHKNPANLHTLTLNFGKAYVFYPEAEADRCTVALLLDVDPVSLVRGREGSYGEGLLSQYVNDRPYVASSLMSVALVEAFRTAMGGRSKERPELAQTPLPLQVRLSVMPCHGGEALLRRLFEPLGYTVSAQRHGLDDHFPEWGESGYYTVELQATVLLSELLTHLYVLIPVLDNDRYRHYVDGNVEVEKLLRRGAGWLASHPQRELIASRYLKYRKSLIREALARLMEKESPEQEVMEARQTEEEVMLEKPLSLNTQRMNTVLAALKHSGAHRVLDLGCGEGRLLKDLLDDSTFTEVVGMDVSCRALERAQWYLHYERMPEKRKERLTLLQGSLIYRDKRLAGYDAAAVVEVIEHLDPPRLAAFERVLFEFVQPTTVVMTTPNVEYNATFANLPAGKLRHRDHRFEWSRAEFRAWANDVAQRFGYTVRFAPVGPEDPTHGPPTQMGVFTRA